MALQQFAAGREKADTAKTPVGTPVVEIEIRDVVIQTGGEIVPDYEGEYEVTPQVDEPCCAAYKSQTHERRRDGKEDTAVRSQ